MIEAYIGMPGSGKTYLMTKMAMKKLKKGHRVYANYPLQGATGIYNQISELYDIKRLPDEKLSPIILLDEAGLAAPAGSWKAIPFDVMSHWRQHRHAGVNIFYTAQDLRDVATPLRRVTQLITDITKFGPLIRWKTVEARSKSNFGGGFTFFDLKVAKQYDSYAENVQRQEYLKGL